MNLNDSFPARNLPPQSEKWGREVEERVFQLANANSTGGQSLSGLNRTTAAAMSESARQLQLLSEQVERVTEAYAALPAPVQGLASASDFAVPLSGSWNTLATVSFLAPKTGTMSLSATASGMLKSTTTSTNVEASARIVMNGIASAALPGNFASPDGTWRNSFFVPWGWTEFVTESMEITVSLQVAPNNGASWPAGTGSYATLTVMGAVALEA